MINCLNLERTLDLSSSSCETIASLLELPPFCLLTVDDIGLDRVKGQLSCSDPGSDVLLRAILECNRAGSLLYSGPRGEDPVNLFCTAAKLSSGLIGSEIENEFNMSRAYFVDFDVSIFELMKITSLCKDEITRGLYRLQKAGNLKQYSLHDNCVYVTLSTTKHIMFKDYAAYIEWLWSLATQVQDILKNIEEGEVLRVVNMWKFVNHLDSSSRASKCSDGRTELDVGPLLERYMGRENASDSNKAIDRAEFEFKESTAIPGNSRWCLFQVTCLNSFTDCILTHIRTLLSDDRLKILLIGFTREYVKLASHVVVEAVNFREQLAICKALYVARIMHGLTSPLIAANAWKETNAWGRYREIPFDQVIHMAFAALTEKQV